MEFAWGESSPAARAASKTERLLGVRAVGALGDACPVSRAAKKGDPKAAAKSAAKGNGKSGKPPGAKVMVVRASGNETQSLTEAEPPEQEFGSYFTTLVCRSAPVAHSAAEVFVTKPADFSGFAVLDTACQKTVCSDGWLQGHSSLLRQHKMSAKTWPEKEGFQFGFGPVQFSFEHALFLWLLITT